MAEVPILGTEGKGVIENEYIVKFHKNSTDEIVTKHMFQLKNSKEGCTIIHEYNFGSFRGYAIRTSTKHIDRIKEDPSVEYIEVNQEVHMYQAQCTEETGAEWNLVRTVIEDVPNRGNYDGKYDYKPDGAGQGVDVYIIDTGIYIGHNDFKRSDGSIGAEYGTDIIDGNDNADDGNGHGTHVAGTVCGNKYGLAKKATCIAVRVLNDNGSGSTSGVIKGIEYATNKHTTGKKSVANMSLGGGKSTMMNNAVASAVQQGVVFVVAAGNEYQDACSVSPASEPTAITAMCSDKGDKFCYFSNYGKCTDIIAPGMDITSCGIGSESANSMLSGTSMSSPHVAGVAAKILSESADMTPADVKEKLITLAKAGKVLNIPVSSGSETPNKILFQDCA